MLTNEKHEVNDIEEDGRFFKFHLKKEKQKKESYFSLNK